MLGKELVKEEPKHGRATISLSLSNDGGKPLTPSRRGRLLRGYALLDDDSGSSFLQSPPLEIVTLRQMPRIENDDDSIDLGFGIHIEEEDDDDMALYFKSIQLPTTVAPLPRLDLNVDSEVGFVFDISLHEEDRRPDQVVEEEKVERELKAGTDRGSNSRMETEDETRTREQELVVQEVLRRRGGRHKQQRRKKSLGCSSSAASHQSLLDITIEEETAEDLLREEQVDPYTDTLLVRTRSAPNLAAYSYAGGTTDNCKSYECVHVNGINSFRVAETYWSDEPDETSHQDLKPRPVTPDAVSPGAFDSHHDGASFSSDPTERSRRARIARIQRLRRENQHLVANSVEGGSADQVAPNRQYPAPPAPKRPRVAVIEFRDVDDLRYIEARRPKGAEYGPDEVSL
jgi:hypothetical protein